MGHAEGEIGGAGESGRWSDDHVTGADAKAMFVTITNHVIAGALTDALTPLLETYGLLLVSSAVDVVQGAKF